jgi:hypothetical protein
MIDKYIHDDNFLSQEESIDIQKKIHQLNFKLNSRLFAKDEYADGIHIIKNPNDKSDRKFTPHFPMFVAGGKNSMHEDDVLNMSVSILNKLAQKNNFTIDGMGRCLISILNKDHEYKWSYPHVDEQTKHFVMVYYAFDSDGDTILFNEQYDGNTNYENKLTELTTISPKAGSVVIFNGSRYHSYTRPVENDLRCIFNVNFFSNDLIIQ